LRFIKITVSNREVTTEITTNDARVLDADSQSRNPGLLQKRNIIVLADALKNEESCRAGPPIADQVWAARSHRIGLTWAEPHLLFGFTQEKADAPIDHVKRVLDITVAVLRHLLGRRDLEFGDTEAGALEMISVP
jgi:hypothetical protein